MCWSRSRSAAAAAIRSRTAPNAYACGMHNNSNIPVEMIESELPLTITRYELLPDTGGAGRRRGGLGLAREWRVDCPEAVFTANLERFKFRPYGLAGGEPATPGRLSLARDGERQALPSKVGNLPPQTRRRHPPRDLGRRRLRRPGRAAGGGGRAKSRAGLCVGRAAVAPAVRPAEE